MHGDFLVKNMLFVKERVGMSPIRFSLFTRDDSFSKQIALDLRNTLIEQFHDVYCEDSPSIVICIGGDGTLLRAIHAYEDQLDKISFVGIHTGTLGFFTDYTKNDLEQFVYDLHQNELKIESYPLIEAVLDDDETQVYSALNEIRIGCFTTTVVYDIYIDNEYFESVCSSGVSVSTQAGSTGANRALNGAIVDNGLEIMELTQIMPVSHINQHSMTSPYILKRDRVIDFYGKSLEHSNFCYDHLETGKLKGVKKVTVRLSKRKVNFARFRPYSYLTRLKNLF